MRLLLAALTFSTLVLAIPTPHSMPRTDSQTFRAGGLWEGGKEVPANLEAMRVAPHPDYERWVIDFSDVKREIGAVAPKFQIQYVPREKFDLPDGREVQKRPAKFIFVFRTIGKNFLTTEAADRLAKKSKFVKSIVLYPPIEKGDMAMEFVLKNDVLFQPHQPIEKEGRLVLDLKSAKSLAKAAERN